MALSDGSRPWWDRAAPKEMGAGIAASPHCAERRICRCSVYLVPLPERFGTPLLDPGSPAQATPRILQLPLARSPLTYSTARPEGSLVFRSAGLALELRSEDRRPVQNRPMFRGPSWDNLSRVPLRSPSASPPKRLAVRSRVARQEDHLFRRLFPAGPASTPERASALPAGRDRTFGHLPHPSCRCRPSGEAGTAVPIT